MAIIKKKNEFLINQGNGEYLLVYPKTTSDQVLHGEEGMTVKEELESIKNDITNLDYNAVGAERAGAVSSHNLSSAAHPYLESKINAAEQIAINAQTLAADAYNTADEAKVIAEDRSRALVFEDEPEMEAWLFDPDNVGTLRRGDNLYIINTDQPDYWVVDPNADPSEGLYDGTIVKYVGTCAISVLETRKVDLYDYQKKTDNSLQTDSKNVVGAINEINTKASTAQTSINNIVNGTTKVKKAETADSAANATNATNATTATTADKWKTARTLEIKIDSGTNASGTTISASNSVSIDGSANKSLTLTLGNSGVTAGIYSVVQVNSKGIVTSGAQMIEVGEPGQSTPSANLAIGGLFIREV